MSAATSPAHTIDAPVIEEEQADDEISEEEMAPLSDVVRFATCCDWASMTLGFLASFCVGAMQPISVVRNQLFCEDSNL